MTRMWLVRGGTALLLLLIGWGAGSALSSRRAQGWPPRSTRIRVLTTIFPLYDFAREVGGEDVEVKNLLPPGVDPHEFALSAGDIKLIAGADVIISNGGGLDDFITDAIQRAGATQAVQIRILAREDDEAGGDPHLWMDPVYAQRYVKQIAGGIGTAVAFKGQSANRGLKADPSFLGMTANGGFGMQGGDSSIQERTVRYNEKLKELDSLYRQELAPLQGRSLISFHAAFGHLAGRYGLNVAAVWQRIPGREPAPREVGAILESSRRNHVCALFTEPQFSPRALEMIAADAGVPVYSLDPVETADDFDHTHYLDVMRQNLATLVRSLSVPPSGAGR